MEEADDSGGHDVEFVDPLPDDLVCIMCHLALRDPVQIACCGHRFCRTCFDKFASYSKQHNTELVCPLDRNQVEMHQVFSDVAASRAVLGLKVKCVEHPRGCEWVGELRDLNNHYEKNCTHKKKNSISTTTMESGMKDLLTRVEECERCITSQSNLISSLQNKLLEKDRKIDTLQKTLQEQSEKSKTDIETLCKRLEALEDNRSSRSNLNPSILEGSIRNHEQRLLHASTRLAALEKLNPKMGCFEWVIHNYEEQRDKMDTLCSPLFRSSLNGHMCRLSVQWFDRRKSRLGVYLNVPKEENQHMQVPFQMKVVIVCVGGQGAQKTCVLTDFCHEGDTDSEVEDEEVDKSEERQADSAGDAYFLSQPELDKFVLNDTLRLVCYLS